MKPVQTDVDIDCFNRDVILEDLQHVAARIERSRTAHEKHNTGVYFQNIPRDPMTNVATLDHKDASEYGYFKVDFLNVYMYEHIKDEDHLQKLIDTEPDWGLFEFPEVTDNLFHLNGYSWLLVRHKPKSVEDLAMILAIMRPGKAYLQNENWDKIRKEVWLKNQDGTYSFKRAHALSYSVAIIVNLNVLVEQMDSVA